MGTHGEVKKRSAARPETVAGKPDAQARPPEALRRAQRSPGGGECSGVSCGGIAVGTNRRSSSSSWAFSGSGGATSRSGGLLITRNQRAEAHRERMLLPPIS